MKFVNGNKYSVTDKKTKEVLKLAFVSEDEDYLFFNFISRPIPYKSADIIIAKEMRKNFTIKRMIKDSEKNSTRDDQSDLVDHLSNLNLNAKKLHSKKLHAKMPDFNNLKLS